MVRGLMCAPQVKQETGHATQTASSLPADYRGRMQAKTVIVEEVERLALAHLGWQGQECQAQHRSGPQGHACGHNMTSAPSRRLWHTLLHGGFLRGQSSYAKRCRVGTSITEETANFVVNQRLNKSQQMRWSDPEEAPISCFRFIAVYKWNARLRVGPPVSAQPKRAGGHRGMIPIRWTPESQTLAMRESPASRE